MAIEFWRAPRSLSDIWENVWCAKTRYRWYLRARERMRLREASDEALNMENSSRSKWYSPRLASPVSARERAAVSKPIDKREPKNFCVSSSSPPRLKITDIPSSNIRRKSSKLPFWDKE